MERKALPVRFSRREPRELVFRLMLLGRTEGVHRARLDTSTDTAAVDDPARRAGGPTACPADMATAGTARERQQRKPTDRSDDGSAHPAPPMEHLWVEWQFVETRSMI